MKWLALLIFIAMVPALMAWMQANPRKSPLLWSVMGFLPFVMTPWHLIIAPISWAMWPGFVKGLEVSLLDVFAIAIILSYPKSRVRSPIMIVLPLYVLAALFSMAFSGIAEAAFFYVWQLIRVTLLFVAVAKVCQDERGPRSLALGMIAGLCFEAVYAIEQRLTGVTQATGTFDHQNLLGMVSHFAVFPALALLLVEGKSRAPLFGVVAGLVVVILGASRATIGLAGIGYVALLLLSTLRRPTSRKSMIVSTGLIMMAVAAPLALYSLQKRFDVAPISQDYDERAAFERAARQVIADHPMGVGANQYVIVSNTQGYSANAGVAWNSGSRSTNVHNTYLLVQAETGYIGLFAFIAVLLTPIMIAYRYAWRYRKDLRGDLMLGLGIGLTVVSIHCFYEWIFMEYPVQALFAIDIGMIAGLARQMAAGKSNKSKLRRAAEQPTNTIGTPETA